MPPLCNSLKSHQGFTLAELLISLAILGVIATFTIPKILVAQQNSANNAKAKEAIGMIAAAYQQYRFQAVPTASTTFGAFSQYLNYVSVDTSGVLVDDNQTLGFWACNSVDPCLRLHNGGTLHYHALVPFTGTSSMDTIEFEFDPDGKVTDNTTNGPGKSVEFYLFYDGKILTRGELPAGSLWGGSPNSANPAHNPPWFSWN